VTDEQKSSKISYRSAGSINVHKYGRRSAEARNGPIVAAAPALSPRQVLSRPSSERLSSVSVPALEMQNYPSQPSMWLKF
jgi:hypothetical protein